MRPRTRGPLPEAVASGQEADPAPAGEWVSIDGVEYRRVVLCFLFRGGDDSGAADRIHGDRQVLLGLKRTGFGTGRVVALGGKIDGAETDLDAAVREVAEESGIGLVPAEVRAAGSITWQFPARPAWNMAASLFTAEAGNATAVACEEIEPRWYGVDAIPWQDMWQDAPHWVPGLLAGRPVHATVVMSDDNESVTGVVVD
ncbi:NUDIX hydrolase [Arthrobacter pityocampae]|uniref:Oxidized purine nucleoside triphosphate hydrolase n=1 Tax=Arthrobacter pityocampae TaxID=547334 RepID=A0A2S5J0G9_9MICC|nr:NUDIX hydrolase [Arthrobacter pityocampae]